MVVVQTAGALAIFAMQSPLRRKAADRACLTLPISCVSGGLPPVVPSLALRNKLANSV